MDQIQIPESQRLVNQIRLDLLLRRLGSTVLRRKFKEIYVRLNDGQEWRDGPEAGEKFCWSKWGHGAFTNANAQQQEMMESGDIQKWDLHCLQSVITQMLMAARRQEQKKTGWKQESTKGQSTPVNWDPRWEAQMSKIRQLANIRHSIAHMPNETLSESEFQEKWGEAVVALKGLGAKSKEIKEIRQMSDSAFNLQEQGQGQQVVSEKIEEKEKEVEKLRAIIDELQLKIQIKGQEEVKGQDENEIKGQSNSDNINPVAVNKKNESKANSQIKKGDSEGTSGDWDKALEFYSNALEIPDISDNLRQKIHMNRSWVHLRVLQMPESLYNFNIFNSGGTKFETKIKVKTNGKLSREPRFVDEKLLKFDHPKGPKKLPEEIREFHLNAGMADAKSALQLSPNQKSSKALYRLAQFHQLKGDWNSALTNFDLALGQSELDAQLEFDRNVCQLELLNQNELEEFHWIPGEKNRTMAGLVVLRNPSKWSQVIKNFDARSTKTKRNDNSPQQKQQLYADVVKAHSLAQGVSSGEKKGQNRCTLWKFEFDQVVKLYEGAMKGGLPSALYNLGLLLQEGNGVQRNFAEAVRLFKMAANFPIDDKTSDWEKEGVLEAQYRLGLCYEFGLGVGKDNKKALHWFEMASLGDFLKASRKLGDIYFQGLLGVSKDKDMALFCWDNAAMHGDTVAGNSIALHLLQSRPLTWDLIQHSICSFSRNLAVNFRDGTPTMKADVLDRKHQFQSALANVLEELKIRPRSSKGGRTEGSEFGFGSDKSEEREPEEVSWNVPAFVEHTLHMIHLLELAQTPEFKQKLLTVPVHMRSQFPYTNRLLGASKCCDEGLAALQEMNELYRETLIDGGQWNMETDYPADLEGLPEIDEAILIREAELLSVILTSFSNSIRLVGAAYFRDQPCQALIHCLVRKFYQLNESDADELILEESDSFLNATLIYSYILALKEPGADGGENLKEIDEIFIQRDSRLLIEPFFTMSAAAGQGSLGKFERTAQCLGNALKKLEDPQHPRIISKCDLLFVQALCCKSAALARGVNSANRKKVKEAMGIFQKFLSICSKDEPRRPGAHYQLALCTLYLEKMKVKGQVKDSAMDILTKVMSHFTQGEAAEQYLLWKDFPTYNFPVKLFVQQKIRELETLVKKIPGQNLTSDFESSCFGRILDPYFKFPISAAPLKKMSAKRVEVITGFRRLFKAAHEVGGSSSSAILMDKLESVFGLPGSPFSGPDVFTGSNILGYYEIIEPVLLCRLSFEPPNPQMAAYTVVQDDSGAVFNIQFIMTNGTGRDDNFRIGARLIILQPFIRLDVDGRTNLMVNNTEAQVYHLPPKFVEEKTEETRTMSKCGFCGESGEKFQRCSKCQTVYYCSKECQTADWTELKHNWICPFLNPKGK